MSPRSLAEALTSAMLVYFLVINHVPLGRFNNLRSLAAQWRSTAVGLIPGALVLAGLASGRQLAAAFAAGWLWLWFALQLRQWWVPYLFGETPLHRDFGWYVSGGYNNTVRLLPAVAGRPCPDLQHLLLQILTLCAALATTLAIGCPQVNGTSTSAGSCYASAEPSGKDIR